MASTTPKMRSLALPSSYGGPEKYQILEFPTPTITTATQVLIRVHAASLNPGDIKTATGTAKLMMPATFPYKLGHDLSGVVVAVGPAVTDWQVGDEVYTMLPLSARGSVSQYALTESENLSRKPSVLSHTEAASLPCVGATALQCFDRGNNLVPGGLSGKTVFVPAAFSGTGSIGVQLAKHVFGASRVLTTVSTSKLPLIDKFFPPGTVDQVIDYTTENVIEKVGKGKVDFFFDTAAVCMDYLPIMRKGGVVVSVTNVPDGESMKALMPETPWALRKALDAANSIQKWRAGRSGVVLEVSLMNDGVVKFGRLRELVEQGKVKPVVGRTAKIGELEKVKEACKQLLAGKGGVGKFVVEID